MKCSEKRFNPCADRLKTGHRHKRKYTNANTKTQIHIWHCPKNRQHTAAKPTKTAEAKKVNVWHILTGRDVLTGPTLLKRNKMRIIFWWVTWSFTIFNHINFENIKLNVWNDSFITTKNTLSRFYKDNDLDLEAWRPNPSLEWTPLWYCGIQVLRRWE